MRQLACQRFIALNDRDGSADFSKSIAILKGVVNQDEKYLTSYESAQWYGNCLSLLNAIYGDQGDKNEEIQEVLLQGIASVESAEALTAREQMLITNRIRMAGSDSALHRKDWAAAIEWVQPIIDSADQYMEDTDGVARLAMATRQQSMFLAENGDSLKSSELIDTVCEMLENTETVEENIRLIYLCMLRGKHLINFPADSKEPHVLAGWEKYQKLSDRILKYEGPDRARVLRSYTNMHRLAFYMLKTTDIEQALNRVREIMKVIASEPELQNPRFGALTNLHDMTRTIGDQLRINQDPREAEFKQEVIDYNDSLKKEKASKE